MHIQTNHIDNLFRKKEIITYLEILEVVRFKISSLSYLPNLPSRDAGISGHKAYTPMCCLMRNLLNGHFQDTLDLLLCKLLGLTRAGELLQAINARLFKAIPPFMDRFG
jgi:hypothetical protein